MIAQVSADPNNPGPVVDGGGVHQVRVVRASNGATIAFDTPSSKRSIFGNATYKTRRAGGWNRIYLTGTVTIEYTTDPLENLDPLNAGAFDPNNYSICVGAGTPGAPAGGVASVQEPGTTTAELDSGPVAIGNGAVTTLVNGNPNRIGGVTIQNTGANPVWISKQPGVTNAGALASFQLAAGQVLTVAKWAGPLYGICSAGQTSTVLVGAF